MHESTISRVTSNKYLSCERGLFELKYFFTSGIQSADGGDAVSAHAVKDRIKALIGAELADTILSDDKLVELLRGEGFDIARRTVAKYREALGIGSSVQRRRQRTPDGHPGSLKHQPACLLKRLLWGAVPPGGLGCPARRNWATTRCSWQTSVSAKAA